MCAQGPEAGGDDEAPLVVVVEDDLSTLTLLADVALDAGWSVRTCRAIGQMRRELERVAPALIILDDELPDGRGADVIGALRSDPRCADVPVVVCTAAGPHRCEEIRRRVPVVTKPFTITEIERVLDDAASRRTAHRPGTAG
jgi:DNA-binding response OmpR family regulator